MSVWSVEELERDEATIARRVGHRLAWPEILALIITAAGIGFAVGLVL